MWKPEHRVVAAERRRSVVTEGAVRRSSVAPIHSPAVGLLCCLLSIPSSDSQWSGRDRRRHARVRCIAARSEGRPLWFEDGERIHPAVPPEWWGRHPWKALGGCWANAQPTNSARRDTVTGLVRFDERERSGVLPRGPTYRASP
jgi:hypothetical protein